MKSHMGLQEDSPLARMAQLIESSDQLGLILSDTLSSPGETVSDRAWTGPSVVEIRLDTTLPVLSDTPHSSPPPSMLAGCQHAGPASPPQPFHQLLCLCFSSHTICKKKKKRKKSPKTDDRHKERLIISLPTVNTRPNCW